MHPCLALGMSQCLCPTTHCSVASQHLIASLTSPFPAPLPPPSSPPILLLPSNSKMPPNLETSHNVEPIKSLVQQLWHDGSQSVCLVQVEVPAPGPSEPPKISDIDMAAEPANKVFPHQVVAQPTYHLPCLAVSLLCHPTPYLLGPCLALP